MLLSLVSVRVFWKVMPDSFASGLSNKRLWSLQPKRDIKARKQIYFPLFKESNFRYSISLWGCHIHPIFANGQQFLTMMSYCV